MSDEKLLSEQPDEQETGNRAVSGHRQKRERSGIDFPYIDLTEAFTVARGVHSIGGSTCEWEQLAAKLNLSPNGGGFRQRMQGARVFGLLTYSQKRISLTSLGAKICDPLQEESAKSEAFLAVPLYKAIYERYKSVNLPPTDGLGSEMASLGVPQKQTNRARQVFQRSAHQAGFFWSGSDRLVLPTSRVDGEPRKDDQDQDNSSNDARDSNAIRTGFQHPFVDGLIKTLPKTEGPWPMGRRVQWLQAAVSVFNLIYTDDDASGSIEVKLVKESA